MGSSVFSMATYGIEVYAKNGTLLGDIRHLARNLKWSEERNAAEAVSFDMDLHKYENYIAKIGANPFEFLDAAVSDIRIIRNGKARVGAHLVRMQLSPDDPTVKVELEFSGYLNYFKDAYIDANFTGMTQGDILWHAIEQYQAKPNGDFGVRRGAYSSQGPHLRDRHERRKNLKDFIVRLSNVIGGPDFAFTPDKKFNSYDAIGSHRPDVKLIYPENVDSFSIERSADSLANYIIGIGSGNGDDAVTAVAGNQESQSVHYRREKVVTFNSVVRQETLQENVDGVLEVMKDIRELPEFSLHDGVLDLDVVRVGDTIYVELQGFESLKHIKGNYRIERVEVDVDENDAETVKVIFDDFNIESITEQQE